MSRSEAVAHVPAWGKSCVASDAQNCRERHEPKMQAIAIGCGATVGRAACMLAIVHGWGVTGAIGYYLCP